MLLAFIAVLSVNRAAAEVYYNIAHMTNTIHAVDWAIAEGANAVEFDLEFTTDGRPRRFYHGGPCDCSCICPWSMYYRCDWYPRFVCSALRQDSSRPCNAESSVEALLNHAAGKSEIALVYIDSKINDNTNNEDKQRAGRRIVQTLNTQLFSRGYGGYVIIGAFSRQHLSYVEAAVGEAALSPYSSKIFFSVELGSLNSFNAAYPVMRGLNTNRIVFGTGETSCSPRDHDLQNLATARTNKEQGTISMAYTWTDDAISTIRRDLTYVNGIITNYPSRVRDALRRTNKQLATQSSTIHPATPPRYFNPFSYF